MKIPIDVGMYWVNKMEKSKTIHLEKPNTLSNFLTQEERQTIVSLKITGLIGRKDFDDVLDEMCYVYGYYDDDDNWMPDYNESAAIRHLDLGEATYVDGDNLPYFGYHAQLETFILPKGIKSTQEEFETGLSESEMLKTLVLPEGLKSVGGFHSCPNLKDVILPEGLEEIGWNAFAGCTAITSIRIPASVRWFFGNSFAGCKIKAYEVDSENPYFTAVDGVVYSKDLTTLVAFPSAYPHERYEVPETTRIIEESAFEDSCISDVELPTGLTSIKDYAFQGSNIRKIELPDTVTELGELVFRFCYNLEHIRLSNGLSTIPRQTFRHLRLKRMEMLTHIQIPVGMNNVHIDDLMADTLTDIVMESAVPPETTGDLKYEEWRYRNVNLLVPAEAVTAYQQAPGWKSFNVKTNE